jgi:hypothetical protein
MPDPDKIAADRARAAAEARELKLCRLCQEEIDDPSLFGPALAILMAVLFGAGISYYFGAPPSSLGSIRCGLPVHCRSKSSRLHMARPG